MDEISEQGLIYVCGWLAFKFKKEYSQLGEKTCNLNTFNISPWLRCLSKGGLMQPSQYLVSCVKRFEKTLHFMVNVTLIGRNM